MLSFGGAAWGGLCLFVLVCGLMGIHSYTVGFVAGTYSTVNEWIASSFF